MPKSDRTGDLQFAALPYRFDQNLNVEVMLLTSRETRRWVIPRGWPMVGKKPHRVAEIEAYQEGGVLGKVSKTIRGSYCFSKEAPGEHPRLLLVEVYPMLVTQELPRWPEGHERERAWFSPEAAASMVAEGTLALMIESLQGVQKKERRTSWGHRVVPVAN